MVDERDRLLLFYSRDFVAPGVEYYVTVGGGIEPGESPAEAAGRELFEETGLRVAPADLGPMVARAEGRWSDGPDVVVHSEDHYFFYRAPHFDAVRDGLEPVELEEFTESRWLTVAEVEAVDPIVFPARVATLLKGLIAGATPQAPVRLQWSAWCWDTERDWTATERPTILER
ncbi:hypothetical protein GCM10027447_06340 [Glycomyces halotolerans]